MRSALILLEGMYWNLRILHGANTRYSLPALCRRTSLKLFEMKRPLDCLLLLHHYNFNWLSSYHRPGYGEQSKFWLDISKNQMSESITSDIHFPPPMFISISQALFMLRLLAYFFATFNYIYLCALWPHSVICRVFIGFQWQQYKVYINIPQRSKLNIALFFVQYILCFEINNSQTPQTPHMPCARAHTTYYTHMRVAMTTAIRVFKSSICVCLQQFGIFDFVHILYFNFKMCFSLSSVKYPYTYVSKRCEHSDNCCYIWKESNCEITQEVHEVRGNIWYFSFTFCCSLLLLLVCCRLIRVIRCIVNLYAKWLCFLFVVGQPFSL